MNREERIQELERELAELKAELPTAPQHFKYYLHDGGDWSERREWLEGQGIRLSEEAWENFGRPFYEVTLECSVDPDGVVTLLGAKL